MAWYAIYKTVGGTLVSITTVLPEPLPRGHSTVELGETKPDWSVLQWDPSTLGMIPKPPPPPPIDRVDDLISRTPTVNARLTVATRTTLRDEVAKLLGPYRFREQSEPVEL